MRVPFVDLQTQYRNLEAEILPRIRKVMEEGSFILGPEVREFEQRFAEFCGVKHCVGVASGCDALLLAMKACGIGPGDEVITVTNTYIATVLAITAAGAKPVLVDCLPDSYLMDHEQVSQAVTPSTRAIIPVHLYGQAADMDAILSIAAEHDLVVIEDAAQAHGATYKGRPCGSMGKVGCFSFYPGKNLGAYGDGGAVVTDDAQVADTLRMLGNYGQREKYRHEVAGWNSRLDSMQAAVLNVKLKRLTTWNDARRAHARQYRELLADTSLVLPVEVPGNRHVYHLFVIQVARRDELLAFLGERGISCGIHYPIPVHMQKAYACLGYPPGRFPRAERVAGRLLSLPMFAELTEEQVELVCRSIKEFVDA